MKAEVALNELLAQSQALQNTQRLRSDIELPDYMDPRFATRGSLELMTSPYQEQRSGAMKEFKDLILPMGILAALATAAVKGYKGFAKNMPSIIEVSKKVPTKADLTADAVKSLVDSTKWDLPYNISKKLDNFRGTL